MSISPLAKIVMKKVGPAYHYKEHLGIGGYSEVHLIEDVTDAARKKERVLKIMRRGNSPADPNHKRNIKRFLREGKIYRKLHGKNFAEVIEAETVCWDPGDGKQPISIPYLIMTKIPGEGLNWVLGKHKSLDLKSIIKISEDILKGLQILHDKHIIHRDIKPGNIIVEKKTGNAVLIDYGIARDMGTQTILTTNEDMFGSAPYMPPEQFDSVRDVKNTADIYSVGVVLYEMLTGKRPFSVILDTKDSWQEAHEKNPIPNAREKRPGLPGGIEDIVYKAMAKKPGDRYRSAGEFLKDIGTLKEKVRQRRKRIERISALAGSFLLIALILVFLFISESTRIKYRALINSANRCIENGQYEKAREVLKDALEIKETGEVRWLLKIIENRQEKVNHGQ